MNKSKKILITGGSGLIGQHLIPLLIGQGYHVNVLSRSNRPISGAWVYKWDPAKGNLPQESLENVGAVVHLAGASIGEGRWTEKRKQEIIDSRVWPVKLLAQEMKTHKITPDVVISASAVGLYDNQNYNLTHDEQSPAGSSFLSKVVVEWEQAVRLFASPKTRTVNLRTGVVLDKEKGALPQMALPVKIGLGAPLGSGDQKMPWIHILDICRLYYEALINDRYRGAYNAIAPECVSNYETMATLSRVLRRPLWPVRVPSFLIKFLMGDAATLVLDGACCKPERIKSETDFEYLFPTLESALSDIYSRKTR